MKDSSFPWPRKLSWGVRPFYRSLRVSSGFSTLLPRFLLFPIRGLSIFRFVKLGGKWDQNRKWILEREIFRNTAIIRRWISDCFSVFFIYLNLCWCLLLCFLIYLIVFAVATLAYLDSVLFYFYFELRPWLFNK